MFKALVAVAWLLPLVGGCTHWEMQPVYGQSRVVGRRLNGAPQVEETTAGNVSAGFAGISGPDSTAGGLSAAGATVKRTHCVQAAEVDYVQPYELKPTSAGRALDAALSIVTAVVGLSVIGAASSEYSVSQHSYESDLNFYNMDPSFFPKPDKPSPPTTAYFLGGAIAAGGAGWLVYSFAELPTAPMPPPESHERRWTSTEYVEATGCGLVPADR